MLETLVIEPKSPATAAVIWMHGLGADGNDFVPIVPELELPPTAGVRFVFPHAPHRAISINNGYVMRGWYDIYELNSLQREDADGIAQSARDIEALIAAQRAAGIAANRIVLAGFSQGAAIALYAGLRHAESLAGIVALSGYLPLMNSLAHEASPANARTPLFLAHGTIDDVVPLRLGERTRASLEKIGYAVQWRTYPMPHSVCPEEIADIGRYLRALFAV